jgi:tetratricopeptide (TPR) repeat protein
MMSVTAGATPDDEAATLTALIAGSELRVGDVLGGRFRIDSLLGVGGMGVVYRAWDLSLEIEVALKLLRPELARKPESFQAFRQELLLARQVSSPYVVRIHDLAEHEGRWFISMDLVRGESLERRCARQRRLPLEQALAITRGLLEGLSAAHQRGVVHRDLKPANVLLAEDGHPYISDFGVARMLGAAGLTQTGMIVGTPEYLSPEQARGGDIDARSDLYTVGLILYEMLTGQLPFAGGTPAETVIRRVLRPPPPLSSVRPDLPAWLQAFCARLLMVRPAHRFPSAAAALQALDTRRVPRPPLDRRALAVAAALLLALGGLAAWLVLRPPPPPAAIAAVASTPRLAVLPFAAPAGDASLASTARALEEHLRQWLRSDAAVATVPRRRVLDARARTAPGLEGAALQRQWPDLARAAGADRLVRGTLALEGGELLLELSWIVPGSAAAPATLAVRGKDAATLFAAWLRQAPAWLDAAGVHPADVPRVPPSLAGTWGEALLSLDRGDADAAAATGATAFAGSGSALLEQALLDAQEAAGPLLPARNTRERVLARFGEGGPPLQRALRAQALAGNGDGAAARRELDTAVSTWPHDPELQVQDGEALAADGDGAAAIERLRARVAADEQDARAWYLLGRTAIQQGQAQQAVDEYLVRALVLETRARDAAAEALTRNALGIGYERLGQLDAASEQYERAAAMREELGDKAGLARTLRNLAIVQAQRGERDAAVRTLDRAQALLVGLGDRASLADLHNDRGVIAEERGDFAAALAAYREALGLRQQLDLPDQLAESLDNVGFASFRLGQFDNAQVYWQQALAIYHDLDDENGILRIGQGIALLDMARGRYGEARQRLDASLRAAEDHQLPEEASTAHIDLSELALLEGRYADALAHAGKARALAAHRSDQRTEAEALLLQARAAAELGDAAGLHAALDAIDRAGLNSDQQAMFALAQARLAVLGDDRDAARTALAAAAKAAGAAHSGKLAVEIRLQQVRLDLAAGQLARAQAALEALEREAALGEVPLRLEWLRLAASAALRAGNRPQAVQHYHDALLLARDIGQHAGAQALHAIGRHALPEGSGEAATAAAAATAARDRLLADAPAALRDALRRELARQLRAEAGIDDGA